MVTRSPRRRSATFALAATIVVIVAVAAMIRIWGVGWGLPYAYHADEPVNLTRTIDMVQQQSLVPGSFNYPPFFYYVEAGGQLAYVAVGVSTGQFDSIDDVSLPEMQTLANGRLGNPNSLLSGRLISVLLGVAVVAIVATTIMMLGGGVSGATLGGMLMALGPLAVRQTRFMTPDALATFFVSIVIALSFAIYRRGKPIDYVLAGLAVGLAGSSKYHVAVVAVAVVAAHVLRTGSAWYRDRSIYVAGATAIATFAVASFAIFFDLSSFWAEFAWKQGAYAGAGGGSIDSMAFYARVVASEAGLLLLLVPFAFLTFRFRAEAGIVLGFVLVYLVLIALFVLRFDRHVLPMLPAVAIGIGLGLSALIEILRRWVSTRPAVSMRVVMAGLAIIVVGAFVIPLRETVSDGMRYSSDERASARDFVNALPLGSRVLVDAYSPFIDPERFEVTPTQFVAIEGGDLTVYDFVTLSEQGSGRFIEGSDVTDLLESAFEGRFREFCEIAFFPGPPWQRVLARDCPPK